MALRAPVEMLPVEAAADGGASALRRFTMSAYTGGPMSLRGWRHPTVIDLAGIAWSDKPRPILKDHNPALIVGHTEGVSVVDGVLRVAGVVSGGGAVAREVVDAGLNGFPWQASVGAHAVSTEFVPQGKSASANGQTFDGPVSIVRRSGLGEVSFVALGADDNTNAQIAAEAAGSMENQTMPEETTNAAVTAAPVQDATSVAAEMRAGRSRPRAPASARSARPAPGRHAEIEAKAISEGWDPTKAELEVLRASRPVTGAPAAHVRSSESTPEVLEAALCKTGRLPGLEEHFDEKTLDAADRRFGRGLGLQEVLLEAAWANGHTGRSIKGDTRGVLAGRILEPDAPGHLLERGQQVPPRGLHRGRGHVARDQLEPLGERLQAGHLVSPQRRVRLRRDRPGWRAQGGRRERGELHQPGEDLRQDVLRHPAGHHQRRPRRALRAPDPHRARCGAEAEPGLLGGLPRQQLLLHHGAEELRLRRDDRLRHRLAHRGGAALPRPGGHGRPAARDLARGAPRAHRAEREGRAAHECDRDPGHDREHEVPDGEPARREVPHGLLGVPLERDAHGQQLDRVVPACKSGGPARDRDGVPQRQGGAHGGDGGSAISRCSASRCAATSTSA
jgi:hypothetical protein